MERYYIHVCCIDQGLSIVNIVITATLSLKLLWGGGHSTVEGDILHPVIFTRVESSVCVCVRGGGGGGGGGGLKGRHLHYNTGRERIIAPKVHHCIFNLIISEFTASTHTVAWHFAGILRCVLQFLALPISVAKVQAASWIIVYVYEGSRTCKPVSFYQLLQTSFYPCRLPREGSNQPS